MESAKEVNVTYETLFEILKREKDMTELQKLDPNFFNNFINYLEEKRNMLGREDSLFLSDEKKKIERQIENARRIIKEIYDRREKKILNIALVKSRTKSNIVDTSSLLETEKKYLDSVVNLLNVFRSSIIENVLDGKPISIFDAKLDAVRATIKQEKEKNAIALEKGNDTKIIRFLCSVPKFVGEELEEYGPFSEEDIANLPSEIAELLINKGRAEEIEEN